VTLERIGFGRTTVKVRITKEIAVLLGEIFGMDGIIVVVVVAVLVFGGAAIPKFARNLGSAKSEFEKGLKESKTSDTTESKPPEADK
jgi:TatA/E family protein of Tat protein translocase